jgi:hypothetical protein
MKRMYRFSWLMVPIAAGLVGCDWTSGGGVDSWNERWNWVNFSGNYRGANGPLVSAYTSDGSGDELSIRNQRVGVGDGVRTSFSGTLSNRPIVPRSVTIQAGGFSLTDDGGGVLSNGGRFGSINYETGAWSIGLAPTVLDAGVPILASYQYRRTSSGGGATRFDVLSLTVFQEGNILRFTDNNGAVYEGKMGSIRGSGGFSGEGARPAGEVIIAQFNASGVSRAGVEVRLTGTLEATIQNDSSFSNRRITGTWIEARGQTGNINGTAGGAPLGPVNGGGD